MPTSAVTRLREALARPGLLVVPAAYDALSTKLVEEAGFPVQFMSGFAVALTRLGFPDTGLISFAEMLDTLRNITAASSVATIADGDDGYGNPINAQRTVREYARAGAGAVMIEDKINPKRLGTEGEKPVLERGEAVAKLRAAIETAHEQGILVLARTDARATRGFDEALARVKAFVDLGADMTFLDGPQSVDELTAYCRGVKVPCMVNIVQGDKLGLTRAQLEEIGVKIATRPFAALSGAIHAARRALAALKAGDEAAMPPGLTTAELRTLAGYPDYHAREKRFTAS
jgi:2-methylisocitrate lyase-like PEP mutase family enzyme